MATDSQIKGNAAEYLVCYELQKHGIPVWQLGGNNKRWDIVFQSGEDKFIPAQVKARTQSTLAFKKEDAVISKGYYFVSYEPAKSILASSKAHAKKIEELNKELFGEQANYALLLFSSKDVIKMCNRTIENNSNKNKSNVYTYLTVNDIENGIKGFYKFIQKYGK